MEKIDVKKVINIVFIILMFCIIFGVVIIELIRGPKEKSIVENRGLMKMPKFSLSSFIDGSFQTDLEQSLSDQMIGGEIIKKVLISGKSEFIVRTQGKITKLFNRESQYRPVQSNICYYGDSDYMVFKPMELQEYEEKMKNTAGIYNEVFKDVDSYFYLVTNSHILDFDKKSQDKNEIISYLKDNFTNFKFDYLKINNFDEYKNYFYKTDHHWNYKGQLQGYNDIINLLLPGEDTIKPVDTQTFDVNFYGSNARNTSIYSVQEKFTVYNYNLPEYKTYINHVEKEYNEQKKYYEGKYSSKKGVNHYALFYGGDYGEVEYDFNQPNKENLLVIAPSYSNAINNLIASHFNKTYYIDLRFYEEEIGKQFNAHEFIEKNKIDKVLLLMCADHFGDGYLDSIK